MLHSDRRPALRLLGLLALLLAGACASAPPEEPAAPTEEHLSLRESGSAWGSCGKSTLGKDLRAITLGRGPLRVYLVGGIHGDEREGSHCLDEVVLWLRDASQAERLTVRVLEDLNPDGSARGSRGNSQGVDLNRNWPATNFRPSRSHGSGPASEVEVAAVVRDLEAFRPDLVVVFHSARSGPFVNWDGPAEAWAEKFAAGARRSDPRWDTRASMGYPTPGSLGTWIGVDQEIPILTVEFRRGQDAASARRAGLLGVQELLAAPPPENPPAPSPTDA